MISGFGPIGDSAVISLTTASQTFALGTLAATNPAIRLISLNATQSAWYIKFGTSGAVTVSLTDGMRIVPASAGVPMIIPTPTGATHVAILAEGPTGDAQISYGGFRDGEFSPGGDSVVTAVTQTSQTVALPTLASFAPCLRLVSKNPSITSLWVKLGTGAVTGDLTTSMKVSPGSVDAPTLIPITAGQTHVAIFCEGVGGDVVMTGGGLRASDISSSDVLFSTGPRILGRTSGAGAGEELTLTQVLDFVGSAAQGDILYRGASTWTRLAAGTSRQLLQTLGNSASPQWIGGAYRIASVTASGASTVDFTTIPAGVGALLLTGTGITVSVDAARIDMRFSQGGTFLSGASDYSWNNLAGVFAGGLSPNGDTADNEITLALDVGNAAGEWAEFELTITSPLASGNRKAAFGRITWMNPSTQYVAGFPSGNLIANTNAIDGVRILPSSGTISGLFTLWGMG